MVVKKEIRALTGIRGAAACYVLVYHCIAGGSSIPFVDSALLHGYIAVDLFFCLSGYIMAENYAEIFIKNVSLRNYGVFISKRLFRVYPLYVFTLCLMLIAILLFQGTVPPDLSKINLNVLMIQTWFGEKSINAPSWSISAEFAAYLCFPLIVKIAIGGVWRSAAVFSAAMALLVWVASRSTVDFGQFWDGIDHRHGPLDAFGLSIYSLYRCLGEFTLGFVGWALSKHKSFQRISAKASGANILLAAIIILLPFRQTDLILIVMFVCLIIALGSSESLTSRALASAPAHWLGEVSYSIYLLTHVVGVYLRDPLAAYFERTEITHAYSLSGLIAMPATIALAAAAFYLVEQPGRRLPYLLSIRGNQPVVGSDPR